MSSQTSAPSSQAAYTGVEFEAGNTKESGDFAISQVRLVTYRSFISTLDSVNHEPSSASRLSRRAEKRKMRRLGDIARRRSAQTSQVFLPASTSARLEHLSISASGWMGTNAQRRHLKAIREGFENGSLIPTLHCFLLVHFR